MKSLLKIPYQVMKSLPQWTDRRLLQETPAAIASAATGGNYSVGGGFGVRMVSLFYSHQPQTSVPPVSDSKGGQQSLQQVCAPARIPLNVVVQHAAYEMHLTVDQVKSQVHAGKTFAQIAIARHITVQQLHVFVIYAQQQAYDYWPGLGCITWQDETSNMQRDQGEAAPKGSEFTGVFKLFSAYYLVLSL